MKKLSLRMRLTILIIILLTITSIMLTLVLNLSAIKMVDTIEMTPIIVSSQNNDSEEIANFELSKADNNIFIKTIFENAKSAFKFESIIAMIVIIFIGGLLTYLVSGETLKPIKTLSAQIKTIDINNLSSKLVISHTKDEISELSGSFNNMTDKLASSFAMQKQFASNAAHELRTPLAVLQTKVDVFNKMDNHSEADYDSLINVFEKHTKRMSELVKSLLDLTNLEDIEINESIEVYSLLEDILYDLKSIADKCDVTLKLSGNQVIIYGNYNLIHRALYNLIENGIKYNNKNGVVEVAIENNLHDTVITIRDSGLGIPDELQAHIFEPFYRVDESRSREIAGSGLGLSIVKSIIDKHNGSITVTNNFPCGTSFQIRLRKSEGKNIDKTN